MSDPGQIYDTINKHSAPIQAVAWSSKNVGASVDEKYVLQIWHTKIS